MKTSLNPGLIATPQKFPSEKLTCGTEDSDNLESIEQLHL
jgi:hypothetical protein